jgi:hypothetical protein
MLAHRPNGEVDAAVIAFPVMMTLQAPPPPTSQPFFTEVTENRCEHIRQRGANIQICFDVLPLMLHLTNFFSI